MRYFWLSVFTVCVVLILLAAVAFAVVVEEQQSAREAFATASSLRRTGRAAPDRRLPDAAMTPPPCDSDMARAAALKNLPSSLSLYGIEYADSEIRAHRSRIGKLRMCADAITDPCAKAAYIGWLDHFGEQVNNRAEELTTRAEEARDKERQAGELAKETKLRKWIAAERFPAISACDAKE
jgi:hypothetical protein